MSSQTLICVISLVTKLYILDQPYDLMIYKSNDLSINLRHNSFQKKILKKCDPGETRTLGPLIKSQLLYQLSYEVFW
jgi:hypothetical protein